ncbi:hypothetical protein [Mesorhizobium sp. 1B3]|uniref:hypothetical protein n=1 Tax=Mesorhizobium sp. 1B3 TaxID=3243599 RepID=UPI003D97E707
MATNVSMSGLRSSAAVMAPRRLLAAYPTALNFARSTVAHLARHDWRLTRLRFDINAEGIGTALYRLDWGAQTFHFLVVSKNFPADQKTDRSFGENWDISAVLCEGAWSAARETYLLAETPKQRAGRFDYDTLVTLRGNRSGRVFDHVVESLAAGRLPDSARLADVGYIVRTTGLIANGALGMRPFEGLGDDHPFALPYYLQMVSAMLLREFVFELVDAMAAQRSSSAIRLPDSYRRYLGVGNAAGAGLVAYVAANPTTIHRWIDLNERAIAEAWQLPIAAKSVDAGRLATLLERAIAYFTEDGRDGNGIFSGNISIATGLRALQPLVLAQAQAEGPTPESFRSTLADRLATQEPDVAEVFHALLVELLPEERLQRYRASMRASALPELDFRQTADQLRTLLREQFGWALEYDFTARNAARNFWYRSIAAPLDPRLGVREQDPGSEFEWRMDTAWRVANLNRLLESLPAETPLAHVLAQHPEHRDVARRSQALSGCSYGELHENRLDAAYTPFAAMRLKLAFYGMDKLDPTYPKSVRGALLQGAPTMADLMAGRGEGDWPFPLAPLADAADPVRYRPAGDAAESIPGVEGRETFEEQVCSPVELRRLVSRALHGTGLPLGVADGLALSVESAELWHGNGFTRLAGLLAAKVVRPLRLPAADIANGATDKATGLAALSLGQSPVELACLAARQGKTGVFNAAGATDGRLSEGMIARGDDANCAVVMISSEPDAYGVSIFVPTSGDAGGLISVTTTNLGERADILRAITSYPAFAGSPSDLLGSAAGVRFLAVASEKPQELWAHMVRAAGSSALILSRAEIETRRRHAMRHGIRIANKVKAEIEAFSKAVFIPAGASSGDKYVPGSRI